MSTSLAEVATTEEVAARVAGAASTLIDCDHAAVVLLDPDHSHARIVASTGFTSEVQDDVHALRVSVEAGRSQAGLVLYGPNAAL